MYRKELINFQTNFLVKLKHTLLRRMDQANAMTKSHSHMLLDILGELETRKLN